MTEEQVQFDVTLTRQAWSDICISLTRSINWVNKEADRAERLGLPAIVHVFTTEAARLGDLRQKLHSLDQG